MYTVNRNDTLTIRGQLYYITDDVFSCCSFGEMRFVAFCVSAEDAPDANGEYPVYHIEFPVAPDVLRITPADKVYVHSPYVDGYDYFTILNGKRYAFTVDGGFDENKNGDIIEYWDCAVCLDDAPDADGLRPVYDIYMSGRIIPDLAEVSLESGTYKINFEEDAP